MPIADVEKLERAIANFRDALGEALDEWLAVETREAVTAHCALGDARTDDSYDKMLEYMNAYSVVVAGLSSTRDMEQMLVNLRILLQNQPKG